MERVQIAIPVRGFGETSRRDAWWVQPAAVFAGLAAAVAYMTWPPSRASTTPSADTCRRCTRRSCSATRRTACSARSPAGGRRGCRSRPRSSSSGRRRASGSPATTTGAPTTRRSGPTRRRARSASRARGYRGEKLVPADHAERAPLLPLPRARLFCRHPVVRRLVGDVVRGPATGEYELRHRRRHAGADPQRRSFSAATPSGATRCATSSAAAKQPASRTRRCRRFPTTA